MQPEEKKKPLTVKLHLPGDKLIDCDEVTFIAHAKIVKERASEHLRRILYAACRCVGGLKEGAPDLPEAWCIVTACLKLRDWDGLKAEDYAMLRETLLGFFMRNLNAYPWRIIIPVEAYFDSSHSRTNWTHERMWERMGAVVCNEMMAALEWHGQNYLEVESRRKREGYGRDGGKVEDLGYNIMELVSDSAEKRDLEDLLDQHYWTLTGRYEDEAVYAISQRPGSLKEQDYDVSSENELKRFMFERGIEPDDLPDIDALWEQIMDPENPDEIADILKQLYPELPKEQLLKVHMLEDWQFDDEDEYRKEMLELCGVEDEEEFPEVATWVLIKDHEDWLKDSGRIVIEAYGQTFWGRTGGGYAFSDDLADAARRQKFYPGCECSWDDVEEQLHRCVFDDETRGKK